MKHARSRRFGIPGYAKAFCKFSTPRLVVDVAEEIGQGKLLMGLFVRALHARGLMHVASYEENPPPRVIARPLWQAGPGVDAAPPPGARKITRGRRVFVSIVAFASVIECLVAGEHTKDEIAAETGIFEKTVRKTLDALHAGRMVHISGHQRQRAGSTGPARRIYAYGPGRDVKFKRKPVAESNAQQRARLATLALFKTLTARVLA